MQFHEHNDLRYCTFDIFEKKITQGVFTRHGGTSKAPFHSLNLGGSVGDDPSHVAENRIRTFDALGRTPGSIHDVWLVHGTDIVYADAPHSLDKPSFKADIILTDNPEVSLFMRFADCVPLLFHDPKKHVIGIAHAGWMGTVKGVGKKTIEGMQKRYGSKPEDIIVGIGPSIGVDHYEVRDDVTAPFRDAYETDADQIIQTRDGKTYLDLWKANEIQLRNAGVQQIQISGICTACHTDDWFSHRAEKGKTGRFGALMALQD